MLSKSLKLPYKMIIFNFSVIRSSLVPIKISLKIWNQIYFVAYFKGLRASVKEKF